MAVHVAQQQMVCERWGWGTGSMKNQCILRLTQNTWSFIRLEFHPTADSESTCKPWHPRYCHKPGMYGGAQRLTPDPETTSSPHVCSKLCNPAPPFRSAPAHTPSLFSVLRSWGGGDLDRTLCTGMSRIKLPRCPQQIKHN